MSKLGIEAVSLLFEFEDGSIMEKRGAETLKGIRRECDRPVYVTVTCHTQEQFFDFDDRVKRMIYASLPNVLAGGSRYSGRVVCKPYWFHKLVNSYKG